MLDYNGSEACRKEHGLKIRNQYFGYFSPKSSEPDFIEISIENFLIVENLEIDVHMMYMQRHHSYGERAYFAMD